ncbi:MAG: class I SAM-dependent methyltransferase [Planctomycetes bacterium]|nr:class I SAM-dependent methyltransferase [Planctomycetota bacterium]
MRPRRRAATDSASGFRRAEGTHREAAGGRADADLRVEGERRLTRLRALLRPPSPTYDSRAKARMRWFLGQIPSGGKVLDVGAGSQRVAPNVVTLDITPAPNVDCLGDAHQLPFKDASFHGVLSSALLEHVDDPRRVVSEIHRVLKPGGVVYFNVPFLQGCHAGPGRAESDFGLPEVRNRPCHAGPNDRGHCGLHEVRNDAYRRAPDAKNAPCQRVSAPCEHHPGLLEVRDGRHGPVSVGKDENCGVRELRNSARSPVPVGLDCWRFTLEGLRRLCAEFEQLDSGVSNGPASALAWVVREFLSVPFFHVPLLGPLSRFLAGWLTFWVKYFDFFLASAKAASRIPSGVYFVGRKET